MSDAALNLYDRLNDYGDIDTLINDGATEHLHLECKTSRGGSVNQGTQAEIAKALSGFGNSEGGVVIFGVNTDPDSHSGYDVLAQVSRIPNVDKFRLNMQSIIPELTTPALQGTRSKVLKKKPEDSAGICLLYIPQHVGDPLRTASGQQQFYLRAEKGHIKLPYSLIRSMFASTQGPDLFVTIPKPLCKRSDSGEWTVAFSVANLSSAVARDAAAMIDMASIENGKVVSGSRGFL